MKTAVTAKFYECVMDDYVLRLEASADDKWTRYVNPTPAPGGASVGDDAPRKNLLLYTYVGETRSRYSSAVDDEWFDCVMSRESKSSPQTGLRVQVVAQRRGERSVWSEPSRAGQQATVAVAFAPPPPPQEAAKLDWRMFYHPEVSITQPAISPGTLVDGVPNVPAAYGSASGDTSGLTPTAEAGAFFIGGLEGCVDVWPTASFWIKDRLSDAIRDGVMIPAIATWRAWPAPDAPAPYLDPARIGGPPADEIALTFSGAPTMRIALEYELNGVLDYFLFECGYRVEAGGALSVGETLDGLYSYMPEPWIFETHINNFWENRGWQGGTHVLRVRIVAAYVRTDIPAVLSIDEPPWSGRLAASGYIDEGLAYRYPWPFSPSITTYTPGSGGLAVFETSWRIVDLLSPDHCVLRLLAEPQICPLAVKWRLRVHNPFAVGAHFNVVPIGYARYGLSVYVAAGQSRDVSLIFWVDVSPPGIIAPPACVVGQEGEDGIGFHPSSGLPARSDGATITVVTEVGREIAGRAWATLYGPFPDRTTNQEMLYAAVAAPEVPEPENLGRVRIVRREYRLIDGGWVLFGESEFWGYVEYSCAEFAAEFGVYCFVLPKDVVKMSNGYYVVTALADVPDLRERMRTWMLAKAPERYPDTEAGGIRIEYEFLDAEPQMVSVRATTLNYSAPVVMRYPDSVFLQLGVVMTEVGADHDLDTQGFLAYLK